MYLYGKTIDNVCHVSNRDDCLNWYSQPIYILPYITEPLAARGVLIERSLNLFADYKKIERPRLRIIIYEFDKSRGNFW